MLVATFRPTTESVRKTIVFENDQFVLEGSGAIPAEAVMELDNRGQLSWGNEGMRAWVGARAKAAPEAPTVSQQREPAAASSKSERTSGQRTAWVIGLLVLAFGLIIAFYFFAVFDTSVALEGSSDRVNNIGLMRDQQMGSVFGLVLAVAGGVLMYIGRRRTTPAAAGSSEQPAPAPTAGLVGDLERLTALHQSGALTDQEFAALKAKYTT